MNRTAVLVAVTGVAVLVMLWAFYAMQPRAPANQVGSDVSVGAGGIEVAAPEPKVDAN